MDIVMISKEFFFMCSKQVLRANVTFLAANVLSLIKRHSFNCPQEYREKKNCWGIIVIWPFYSVSHL